MMQPYFPSEHDAITMDEDGPAPHTFVLDLGVLASEHGGSEVGVENIINFKIRGPLEDSRLRYSRTVDENINRTYCVYLRLKLLLATSTQGQLTGTRLLTSWDLGAKTACMPLADETSSLMKRCWAGLSGWAPGGG